MGKVKCGGCHAGSAILSFKLLAYRLRWVAVAAFILSSSLNFLDRGLLGVVALKVEAEFKIGDRGYGYLVSAFSLAYALSAPLAGIALDRFGLNRVVMALVGLWSGISMLTGVAFSYWQLVACRIGLGAGESGGIAAVAKMGAQYLPPNERALGSALGQVGITLGASLAPIVGASLALAFGWRFPFLVMGAIGLLWIPLWWGISKIIPPAAQQGTRQTNAESGSPFDRRLVMLVIANILLMAIYSLWTNWTPLYLQRVHHLTLGQMAKYAWIPPLASNLGGFLGGWLALRWIGQGTAAIPARTRVILIGALGALTTLFVPVAPTPGWAVAAISLSFFWTLAGSVNIYTLPIDLYGEQRAGRAIAALVFAYGLMQTVISPVIGWLVETKGYGPVCWMVAFLPLLAWVILRIGMPSQFTTHSA